MTPQQLDRMRAGLRAHMALRGGFGSHPPLRPLDFAARSADELRPDTFGGMIGQARMKALLQRIVENAKAKHIAVDHLLMVGSAGTGKTTFAQVIAHETGRPAYQLKAPVAYDVFRELAKVPELSVVIIDEIHMQVSGDRRGLTQAADPEIFYHVLEDKRLLTSTGTIPFPDLTFIGCTTDAGMLPEPFLARFPIQPNLDPYTVGQMVTLAERNARQLNMVLTQDAGEVFANACRRVPRVVNRYIRNARSLGIFDIDHLAAVEIVEELNTTTLDGLTRDMQFMLRFLLRCKREDAKGNVKYQSGLSSIATALGKSRDSKAVSLYVEPWLIEEGYIAITHGGRALTDAGLERAERL